MTLRGKQKEAPPLPQQTRTTKAPSRCAGSGQTSALRDRQAPRLPQPWAVPAALSHRAGFSSDSRGEGGACATPLSGVEAPTAAVRGRLAPPLLQQHVAPAVPPQRMTAASSHYSPLATATRLRPALSAQCGLWPQPASPRSLQRAPKPLPAAAAAAQGPPPASPSGSGSDPIAAYPGKAAAFTGKNQACADGALAGGGGGTADG